MNYVSVTSSNIAEIAYDEVLAILGIKFTRGGEYFYDGVPREVYDGCLGASSVGRYFDTYVKKAGYPCRRMG